MDKIKFTFAIIILIFAILFTMGQETKQCKDVQLPTGKTVGAAYVDMATKRFEVEKKILELDVPQIGK